jgi:hypothetical protein
MVPGFLLVPDQPSRSLSPTLPVWETLVSLLVHVALLECNAPGWEELNDPTSSRWFRRCG